MANDNEGVWIIIITILLLTFFIIIALIASRISNNATRLATEPDPNPDTGIFLAPCFTDPCNSEFTCDGSFFVCKKPENSPCISYSDCASGLICSGLCVTGATGGLNDFCPCLPNYDCVSQTSGSGLRVCKGGEGVPCTIDSDCVSGVCNSLNQCVGGLPNSHSCTSNGQCASFFCSAGFCQSPEFVTGVKGASCAQPCLDIVGAECNEGLLCECVNGINNPGICTTSDSGLLDACAIDSLCSESLVCYNTSGNNCTAGNPTCTCTFTYDDPNEPDVGTICISGMTENVSQCLNNSGLGCSSGGQCFSTICNGPSKMTVYEFFDQDGVDLGNRFLSAFSTKVTGAFNGPTFESTINPYNMFATSNNNVDTIYVVDYVQG
ncbi:MAG TPA: hypothetical protein VJ201_02845, partial [Candidatus Babeliales bacterium]|nr:hypothetical protein [Candidatus Babeliales bacterium]